jgi:hypothetical protein
VNVGWDVLVSLTAVAVGTTLVRLAPSRRLKNL